MAASQISNLIDKRRLKRYFKNAEARSYDAETGWHYLPQTFVPKVADLVSSKVEQDSKALRMLELHASRTFENPLVEQRTRWLLFSWALRNAITSNLKRIFDLAVSLGGLLMVLPIMVITAIAIKLDSPGPVIFKQTRVGQRGQLFFCYKFRSMYIDAEERKAELMNQNEADEIVFKMKRDPRVTRVGRIIRKLSIDELPQIFNVIKGEMSLIGPRPPVPIEVEYYQYEHFRRLESVPGITGLQQVSGRSDITFKRWVALDIAYIDEQSLKKDIEILLKTIPAVITGKGAY